MKPSGELLAVLALVLLCAAQEPPSARLDPAQYAARDTHEQVTLAAKPYFSEGELQGQFGKHRFAAAGVVAVEVLIVNERAEPLRVAWERAQLLSDDRQIEQIGPERAARLIYPPPKPALERRWPRRRIDFPDDRKHAAREALEASLRSQQMQMEVIPPGGSVRGFLYFDRRAQPVEPAHTRLYVPEVLRLPSEEPLLFFEVEFAAYAQP